MSEVDPGTRVALIAGTLGRGGAERQLFYIARALVGAGAVVRLFSLSSGEYFQSRIESLGVDVVCVGGLASPPARLLRIANECRAFRPDLLQSQHLFTNLYAAVTGRLRRVPSIGAVRNDAVHDVRDVGRIIGRLSLRAPTVLAVNSEAAMQRVQDSGVSAERLFFLPNVVDGDFIAPRRRETSPGGALRLGAVGRLVPQKRMDRFIDIVADLIGRGLEVRGVLVGEGPCMPELVAQAKTRGLTDENFEFFGTTDDVRSVYHSLDMLLLTSDWEGTPNVVLEAMAAGVPVAATAVGDVRRIIEDGVDGVVLDPETGPGRMSDRIAAVLEDVNVMRSLAAAARARVEAERSVTLLPRFMAELHERVLR